MRQTLNMPKLGLTMTEGAVVEWLKQPGDRFDAGEALYLVENDKVTSEVEAPAAGTLAEIVVAAGGTAAVGAVVGYWEDGQAAAPARPDPDLDPALEAPAAKRRVATPYARRLAHGQGIALEILTGSGPGGRIVARDVPGRRELPDTRQQPDEREPVPAPEAVLPDVPVTTIAPDLLPGQTLTAPSRMQTSIARRLTASKRDIPHFYLSLDIDVTHLVKLRKRINEDRQDHRLTLTHFLVMALARTLDQLPEFNRVWTEAGILSLGRVDVGVAVSTPEGLLAPAVCDVGRVSMATLLSRLDDVVARARSGRVDQADQGHPAITLSNAGMHHVRYMGSIISPGQSMILGVGSVSDVFRPDEDGQPVLRREMGVVLSVDHRLIDGVRALQFLNTVRAWLEQPLKLLMV